MKYIKTIILIVILTFFILTNCKNSDKKTSDKESELQRKELELKQKEVALNAKEHTIDSVQKSESFNPKTTEALKQPIPKKETNLNDEKKLLSEQMIKDADNPVSFKKCIKDSGGLDKVVNIKKVSLSKSGFHQYILTGKSPCTTGARSPYYWIYENRDGKFRKLVRNFTADGVKVKSHRSKGYKDIEIGYFSADGFITSKLKYNGSIYK